MGHNAVAMLMHKAGLQSLPGDRRPHRRVAPEHTPGDLVDRRFARSQPDQLWVTDITEHRTREGKVYCAVVFSRRVVGWSVDSSPTSNLVTSALGMAIDNRRPQGTVIHSGHGPQGGLTSWALSPSLATIGPRPVDGIGWGLLRQRLSRIPLGPDASPAAEPATLADPHRVGQRIFEYLEIFHNRQRRHSSLGTHAPIEYERIHHDNHPLTLQSQAS